MRKLEYNSVTVTLTTGDTVQETDFPKVNGRIIGLSTHVLGDRFNRRVRLALKDGGSETHRPMDVAFTETNGRSTGNEPQLHLNISNPGAITAQIQLDAELEADQTIKVEVLLFSEIEPIC